MRLNNWFACFTRIYASFETKNEEIKIDEIDVDKI